ncbi:MAG: hypothetical protein AAB375_03615 [Patescibacteria group bacterium]
MRTVNTAEHTGKRHVGRSVFIIVFSIAIIAMLFSLTEAGTLAPIASPASSSESFENLYSAIASAGFDSSALAASKNGSALQVAKCIIAKMTGGTPCPE